MVAVVALVVVVVAGSAVVASLAQAMLSGALVAAWPLPDTAQSPLASVRLPAVRSPTGEPETMPHRPESVFTKELTMIRRLALLLIPLAVSACAGGHPKLAEASGRYRPLNAGKWTPTRDDLRGPRAPLPPVHSPQVKQSAAPAAQPAVPAALPGEGA